jgi:hypothetical protein
MARFAPYLLGGLVVLVIDHIPAATRHVASYGVHSYAPPITVNVNRARKGDRERMRGQQVPAGKPKLPPGCEPAFSPIAAPALAHHTGRCIAATGSPATVA